MSAEPEYVYTLYDHTTEELTPLELTEDVVEELNKRLDDLDRCRVTAMTKGNSYVLYK